MSSFGDTGLFVSAREFLEYWQVRIKKHVPPNSGKCCGAEMANARTAPSVHPSWTSNRFQKYDGKRGRVSSFAPQKEIKKRVEY